MKQLMQNGKKICKKAGKNFKVKVKDMFRRVVALTMTHIKSAAKHEQVSVKEGIRRFGDKTVDAVLTEYAQLNEKNVFAPVNANKLTKKQKSDALTLLTMIKQKRCGKIKGRECADGRKQRRYISKEDSTSPTVHLESLLLTIMIDAFEHRDVATADIAGAFLLADMPEFIVVRLKNEVVDILCEANPEWKSYVIIENNNQVLYLKLIKALYGCILSALLWYETFVEYLEIEGFQLNPYEPCVANKSIQGSQCTVCWYVDDTKISHKNQKLSRQLLTYLKQDSEE